MTHGMEIRISRNEHHGIIGSVYRVHGHRNSNINVRFLLLRI